MRSLSLQRRVARAIGALCFVLALLECSTAHAYGWMIKHGFAKCGACHTDPSGGETLTGMGRAEAEHLLSLGGERAATVPASASDPAGALGAAPGVARSSQFLFGAVREPAGVRLGAAYRHMFILSTEDAGSPSDFSQFPMQLDAYGSVSLDWLVLGGSIGVARGIEGSAHVRGAQLNRELEDGWLLLSRNHFIGVRIDDWTLLRAGRLNLPFGLRIPEHVAWVRDATRTDRESDQQHGLALSYARGPLRFEGMAVLGNFQMYPDRYRERGYALSAEYLIASTAALGVSSLVTRANEDRFTQELHAVRQAHGAFGRFGLSPELALWAEADLLKATARDFGYVGLLQADFEPWRGLHMMLTGELLDEGALHAGSTTSPGAGQPRAGGWFSVLCYLYSHFELRFDLVKRQESPFTLQAQLHLYL